MVESPKDSPNSEFGVDLLDQSSSNKNTSTEAERSDAHESSIVPNIEEPIDVNQPRDTSNIFYAYMHIR